MDKLPFTKFDFWGYLASGFLLLCAVDTAMRFGLVGRKDWTIAEGILAVSVCYVLGHIVAGLSSVLLERIVVHRVFGWPSASLFGASKAPKWLRRLLRSYYGALPAETQQAVLAKASQAGVTQPGEALFWLVFAKARSNERTMARVADFLNQYSFCRNVAMVLLIDSCILWWAHFQQDGTQAQLHWARAAGIGGIALFFRYLKFLRHYSIELFASFAYADEPKAKAP